MQLSIIKDGKHYKTGDFIRIKENQFLYKWSDVEEGSYAFQVIDNNKTYNVTYSHTIPFAYKFEAFLSEENSPKPITGFQNTDIVVFYNDNLNIFTLEKRKFSNFEIDIKDFGYESANEVKISGDFNSWNLEQDKLELKEGTTSVYTTKLIKEKGVFYYKLFIDGNWVPEIENLKIILGENGQNYEKGEIGTGTFSKEAIHHYHKDLMYLNKISPREIEFSIRTQINDVERAFIHIDVDPSDPLEEVYELERLRDNINNFDYFKRIIYFDRDIDNLNYMFSLQDQNVRIYYTDKIYDERPEEKKYLNFKEDKVTIFNVPEWSKQVIWYNIFPERFYKGDHYNEPIYNEFGPEAFEINKLHEYKLEDNYKWNISNKQIGKFDLNRWTSDFGDRTDWEEKGELEINYSLKYARMYGGDIKGIKDKIPYLKDLGITAVWLNPVFYSYQNHKYGTNDFRHISPDFGTIRTSGNLYNINVKKENKYGNKTYVDVLGRESVGNSELKLLEINLTGDNKYKNGFGETEDPETWVWTESDLIMVDLIKELHKNGIRVIFDGVFNHSSNRGWAFNIVLAEGEKSKYKDWYKFHSFDKHKEINEDMSEEEAYRILLENRDNINYNGWAGFNSLPEFNSYNQEFKEHIFNITRKWMYGPDGKRSSDWMIDDGIDGWRLDVPNCLANQDFWVEWREVVKECKKDAYITAELWGNAGADINNGNKFDAVMNYEWLKVVIGYFVNQSPYGGKTYKLKATDFLNELREKRTWYPLQSLQASQNLNGSHDTDRLLSRIINDGVGRDLEEGKQIEQNYNSIRPDLSGSYHPNTSIDWRSSETKPKDILKLISIFQMTYIGAPMIYYGDEVGMWGATDPYCRKPMLWDEYSYDDEKNPSYINEGESYKVEADFELFAWYKKLISIRKENNVLVYGKFKELYQNNEEDVISYERVNSKESIVVVLNNSLNDYQNIKIKTEYENQKFIDLITGNAWITDLNGNLDVSIRRKKGMILKRWKKY